MKYRVTVRTSPGVASHQDFRNKADALHFIGYLLRTQSCVTVIIQKL